MFFVMKVSKLCNLRCTYCYEYDELANKERMPLDRLEHFFETLGAHYVAEAWPDELSFVLHGGEPLLLPDDYLRSFVELQRTHLGARGIRYRNSLQTNLYRIDTKKVRLLEDLGIALGVSLDVFGAQRVNVAGNDTQESVIDNLQMLFDEGAIQRLGVGIISVLHRLNLANAEQTFRFCDSLGLDYRMLPMFSIAEPPERVRHLTVEAGPVVEAMKRVAHAQLTASGGGRGITVYPLWNFFLAAIHHISGVEATTYDPRVREWAVIVNTNGDAYNHAEAYTPEGLLGNVFTQPFSDVLASEGRRRTLEIRMAREAVCASCPYARSCTHVPIVEALPSERSYDDEGRLHCTVARPMIDYLVEQISQSPEGMAMVVEAVQKRAAAEGPEPAVAEMTS